MHYSAKQGANRRPSTEKSGFPLVRTKNPMFFWAKMKQTADDFEIGQFPHYILIVSLRHWCYGTCKIMHTQGGEGHPGAHVRGGISHADN
jgi:hypothetical protein